MKIIRLVLFFLSYFLISKLNFAQKQKVDQEIILESRINSPITTKVVEQNGKYIFYATNKSFYPYQLNIKFTELRNLTPGIMQRTLKVFPGTNKLFSFSIKNPNESHSFKYETNFRIGIASKNPDLNYPYLFPINSRNKIHLVHELGSENTYFIDCFKLNKGDTIYNMRKGQVLATPNRILDADRISSKKSMEILHKDGTIMIYENIDPRNVFVKNGSTIYPNQAIGLINDQEVLEVNLYKIEKNHSFKRLEINFYIEKDNFSKFSADFENIKIAHPIEIITTEMTKREKKRYLKTK